MSMILPRLYAFIKYGLLALITTVMIACAGGTPSDGPAADVSSDAGTSATTSPVAGTLAKANLVGTELAPEISGQLALVKTETGLTIQGQFVNVPPGLHGLHIHEGSSCAEAGSAAGGHFNPKQVDHGDLRAQGFEKAHAGDLGNIEATADGQANWDIELPGLTLSDGDYAVAGRAFIMHAAPDDFGQPTGNAGARIACGIIQPQD